jgi:hypothetical protein
MGRAEEVHALCKDISAERDERKSWRVFLKKDVSSSLSGFCQTRMAEAKLMREELHQDKQLRRRELAELLSEYGRYRKDAGKDLRKQLSEYRLQNKKEIDGLLSDINDFLSEVRALTKDRAGAVGNTLREFGEARRKNAKETKAALEKSCLERRKDVYRFLQNCRAEREECRKAWFTLYAVKPVLPEQPVERPEEAAEIVEETVFETPVPEEAAAPEGVDEEEIKERIFAYVNSHPQGVKLTDIELEFNIPRIRGGNLTRALIDEGKIAKEGLLYVPLRKED